MSEALPAIYFDYSDLVAYFGHSRFPTGIQRVQIEFFKASVEWDHPTPIRSCTYSEQAGFWVDLDAVGLRKLCELASTPGSILDPEWSATFSQFVARTEKRSPCIFPNGAALVNVGASWWSTDYMPLIRRAKTLYRIRYVPLIYDLIPIITPEYCGGDLVVAFSHWISSVFLHADLLAAISVRTQLDVIEAIRDVTLLTHAPIVMPLDAEFGSMITSGTLSDRAWLLDGFGLRRGLYVLAVGTLEIRKNHLLLFQTWAKLIQRYGAERIPPLVCVGKIGYGFETNEVFLRAHPELKDKLVFLSGLADTELSTLYSDCLFTMFCSTYEGWGLPVTESLCRGKVCLAADHSSLPEAGGEFAEYFESGSVKSAVSHAERLLFDRSYREAKEAKIAADFRPRTWQDVLSGLVAEIESTFASSIDLKPFVPTLIIGKTYYLGQRADACRPDRDAATAEMLRLEDTWHPIESWGVWAKSTVAKLAFILPPDGLETTEYYIYLKLRAPPEGVDFGVKAAGVNQRLAFNADERRTIRIDLQMPAGSAGERTVVFLSTDRMVIPRGSHRAIGIGIESLAVCKASDQLQRLSIIEATMAMTKNSNL